MINTRAFVKHAAVYGLAGLLVQAGGFVLLPLYTHCLTPSDYGVLEILGRMAETVGTCLMFGGFRQALLTFYQQSQGEAERRQIVATALSLFGSTILVGGGFVLIMATPLSELLNRYLQTDGTQIGTTLFRLAILAILLEPLSQIPLTLSQARIESVRLVTINLTQFLFRIVLCIVFVKFLDGGVAGALASSALTGALFGVSLCTGEWIRAPGRPSLIQIRLLLRFALPLVPGGLCFLLLHHGDRFFLFRFCSMEDVGTYALGYKLALAVGMFSVSPLYMVWSSQMYKVAQQEDAPILFGTVMTRILAAYLMVALTLALFQDEVVSLLGGASYQAASSIIAPVLLAYYFQSAASLMDAGLYVRHRTGQKLGITLATTVVMIALYAWLIPTYGSMGAAIATLIGFFFLAVLTGFVTQRVFPVKYEWSRLLSLLVLTIGIWMISRLLPTALWSLPIKALLGCSAPLLVWWAGLMSQQEKVQARALTCEAKRQLDYCLARSRMFFALSKSTALDPLETIGLQEGEIVS